MSENTESVTVTDAEIHELFGSVDAEGEAPAYHPILEVWREVLRPAREERHAKITPTWANRIVGSYREISYADMVTFRQVYFDMVLDLLKILEVEIEGDEDCLKPTTPEEDVEANSGHYKNLLMLWQSQLLQWEIDWDCTSLNAAIEIAALSEVHKALFGNQTQQGLTAFLDNIGFEYTESDQADLASALQELREGQ